MIIMCQFAPCKGFEIFSKHRNPAQSFKFAIEQRYNLCCNPMDIHANDTHASLLVRSTMGAGGRHNSYGSALAAHPG